MAAYNQIRATTTKGRDATYVYRLYQDGGTGGGSLQLRAGLRVRWGATGRPLLPRVIASEATLPTRDGDLIDQIVAGGERGHLLRIDRAGYVWWMGFPLPDKRTGSTDLRTVGGTIRAGDGLHLLKGIRHVDSEGNPFEEGDRVTVVAAIIELLGLIGLGLDVEVAPRYWPYNIDASTNPLAVLTVDRGRFTETLPDGTKRGRFAYDCLVDVLEAYKLSIVQQDGSDEGTAWHIVHQLHLYGGEYPYWRYGSGGEEIATGTRDRRVTAAFRLKGGTFEDREPVRSATRRYEHGPFPDFVVNGGAEATPPDDAWAEVDESDDIDNPSGVNTSAADSFGVALVAARDEYGVLGQGHALEVEGCVVPEAFRFGLNARNHPQFVKRWWYQEGPDVPYVEGAQVEFSLRARLRYQFLPANHRVPRPTFYAHRIGNNWLQISAEGEAHWVNSTQPVWIWLDLTEEWETRSYRIDLPTGGGVVETYLACPVEGEGESELWRQGPQKGLPVSTHRVWAQWDDVHAQYIDASGENVSITSITVRDTGSTSTVDLPPVTTRFGTLATSLNPGAILHAGDGTLAQSWKRGGYEAEEAPSGESLELVCAEDELRAQRAGALQERATFYTPGEEILPLTSLTTPEGRVVIAAELTRDIRKGHAAGAWDEIHDDAFVSESDFLQEEGARFFADTGGTAALFVDRRDADLAALEVAIARTQELLAPDTPYSVIKTSLFDKPLPAFKSGKVVTLINRANGKRYLLKITENQVAGDEELHVAAPDTGEPIEFPEYIWPESGITSTDHEVQASLSLTDTALRTAFAGPDIVALLAEDLDGSAKTSLQVTPLEVRIEAGKQLKLTRQDDMSAVLFWVTKNAPKGATRLHVNGAKPVFLPVYKEDSNIILHYELENPVPLEIEAEAGDMISVPGVQVQSESLQRAGRFDQVVTRAEMRELERRIEELGYASIGQLADEVAGTISISGTPLDIRRRLRELIPEVNSEVVIQGTRITQTEDEIELLSFEVFDPGGDLQWAVAQIGVQAGQISDLEDSDDVIINDLFGPLADDLGALEDDVYAVSYLAAQVDGEGDISGLAYVAVGATPSFSGVRLKGDTLYLDGDTIVDGTFVLHGDALLDGTVGAEKIVVIDLFALDIVMFGSLASANYVAGTSGMKLFGTAGNVELNDAVVRGTVYATDGEFEGDLTGADMELSGSLDVTGEIVAGYYSLDATMGLLGETATHRAWFTDQFISTEQLGAGNYAILSPDGLNVALSSVVLTEIGPGWIELGGDEVWHAGNDGPGSGLNADLLDGHHADEFAQLVFADAGTFTPDTILTITFGSFSYDVPARVTPS